MAQPRYKNLLTDQHFEDLKVKGYAVVPGVLTAEECDTAISQYQDWLSTFNKDDWPLSMHSLIQGYNTGHMLPTWFVRLKSKQVFTEVWKTDKLLTSFSSIAIGRPPEHGIESFERLGTHWLHVDQSARQVGLHAYQGAVYLEETCEDDWTMHVIEGSHLNFNEIFDGNPKAHMMSNINNYYKLTKYDLDKMEKSGCVIKRVPVPKGGMVLWDSRLVHANARPVEGRKNADRWRYCVFVSMTPAIWASQEDLQAKQEAYEGPLMTTHWSSQNVRFMGKKYVPMQHEHVPIPKALPDIAKTEEAKQLSGVMPYDFKDGNPTGAELKPRWDIPNEKNRKLLMGVCTGTFSLLILGAALLLYRLVAKNK